MNVSIIGAGSFGIALALTIHRAGHNPLVFARDSRVAAHVNAHHIHPSRFSDTQLPQGIRATCDLHEAFVCPEAIVLAIPAQQYRLFLEAHKREFPSCPLIIVSKGIEAITGLLLSEVIADISLPNPIAFLGGPHLAGEIVQSLPTEGILAANSINLVRDLCCLFQHAHFKMETSADPVGVQVISALKNVVALASGITIGSGSGENARALTVARGLESIVRFGRALGADSETLKHPLLLADLLVTSFSSFSRNAQAGIVIGETLRKEKGPVKDSRSSGQTTEGIMTLQAVLKRAKILGITLPFFEKIACS